MEKPEDLFPNLSPEERYKALRDNALVIDETIVTRPFTSEEIIDFKNSLAEKSVELQKEKLEFDKLKKAFEEKTKPMIESIKETTKSLRLRYSETMEEVFLFDDHETGMMVTRDINGVFISQRPLRPSEKANLSISKAG